MRRAEYFFFGVSTTYPLLTSTIILADRGFNPSPMRRCWIMTSPMICLSHFGSPFDGTPLQNIIENYCANDVQVRGKHAGIYIIIFYLAIASLVLFIIIICMGMLFWSVRTKELRVARWSVANCGAHSNGRDQKRVFVKSMLYIGAFLVVWIPPLL